MSDVSVWFKKTEQEIKLQQLNIPFTPPCQSGLGGGAGIDFFFLTGFSDTAGSASLSVKNGLLSATVKF